MITPIIHESLDSGTYESAEADELSSLIQDGEVILEVGAGIGFISTLSARNPSTKRVFAIEANPRLMDVIKRTHQLNSVNVTTFHEMVGDHDGTATFHIHRDFWASSVIHRDGEAVTVPVASFQRRLDECRPTMLIIDIEGAETTLFENVDLRGVRKIMVELHQNFVGRRGVKRVFDTLSAKNFVFDPYHSKCSIATFSHVDRA